MDKMDIFGYAWIPGYRPAISRYLVAEIKKGAATPHDVEQTMKYVDWVKDEYAHGDYSMIEAYLIAHEISSRVAQYAMKVGQRAFTVQRRPPRTTEWTSLRLLEYRASEDGRILLVSPQTTVGTVVSI
jgi:RecB family endonuclease NucS